MDKETFKKNLIAKTGDSVTLQDLAKVIKMFEKRIEELNANLRMVNAPLRRKMIRDSIQTNQDLLDSAKKMFWELKST